MLNPKQRAFVIEYLKDKHVTNAAIRAGYSKKTAYSSGSRLLNHVEVQAEIAKSMNRAMEKAELKEADVIAELRKLAFTDLSKAFGKNGALMHPQDMPEDIRAALQNLEMEELYVGRGSSKIKVGESKKIKLHDKVKSLELLGKYFGIFKDIQQHTVKAEVTTVSETEVKDTLAKIRTDC